MKPVIFMRHVIKGCPRDNFPVKFHEDNIWKCYHFSSEIATFEDAVSSCKSMSGRLFEPRSQELNEKALLYSNRNYWIGVKRNTSSNKSDNAFNFASLYLIKLSLIGSFMRLTTT